MRPRQNLANRLFCIAFLLLKTQMLLQPGKEQAQIWQGTLSFLFSFLAWEELIPQSSPLLWLIFLLSKDRTEFPDPRVKKEKAHWWKQCFWVRGEPLLMMPEDVPTEMLEETLFEATHLYLFKFEVLDSTTLNDLIALRNDFVPNKQHPSLPSL